MSHRLYHFTHANFALEAIYKKRLKVAQFGDVNDPFELLSFDNSGEGYAQVFVNYKAEVAEHFGMLCFSSEWNTILQWSHYADRHKGICLGFDVSQMGVKFGQVGYKPGKMPFPEKPTQEFMWATLCRKYHGWKYEQEWRVFIELKDPEYSACAKRDLYFVDFKNELALREVILGVECAEPLSRIQNALAGYSEPVEVSQIRLDPSAFRLQKHRV
jgi:hypothetical protein